MRKMSRALTGMAVATAMTFTMALAGCGKPEPATEAAPAQEQTTTEKTTTEKTQEQTTTEQAPAQQQSAPAPEAKISVDQAKAAALADAGLSEGDVTFVKTELDFDDDTGAYKYEIDFNVGTTEYEYDIDCNTGAVISRSTDVDDD